MSDLNKILAFDKILPYLNNEEQNDLAEKLGLDIDETKKRLIGKEKESEFILILYFMESYNNLLGIDEGVSQLTRTPTADLIVELKNGNKFMLEIKHTEKDKFSISNGNLNSRIDFAKSNNLDLYFAVSIKGIWMIFDSDYMISKNGKINISDMINSKLDEILGCIAYVFPKNLKIRSVYTKNENVKTTDIQFKPYGKLVSYELYYNNKKIFRMKGQKSKYIGYVMLLQALQDRLSIQEQKIISSGEYTIIEEISNEDINLISEYKFLLSVIEHMGYDNNNKYTPHTYLEQAKENPKLLNNMITKKHIRKGILGLVDLGIDIMYMKNNLIYQIKTNE